MRYSKIVSASEAKYSIDADESNIVPGGGGQSSYNLPVEFLEAALDENVLVIDSEFDYARKSADGDAYLLSDEYSFKLGQGVLWLIGSEYKKKVNKFIGSIGYKNKKFQMFRKVYDKLNKDEYGWFVKLYDKNLTGNSLILDINKEEKILTLDINFASVFKGVDSKEISSKEVVSEKTGEINSTYNRIVFGAPGTGKSYKIEQERKAFGKNYERVTFHPNYSYAQFVGAYKPKPKFRSDGTEYVSYEFVPGPFLRTWIKAQNSMKKEEDVNYLLIIEEINRANVAAVFGDVFQLLDRKCDGTSEYEIATSQDMRDYLIKECGFSPEEVAAIKIPSNMYIWATMNSADQGVLPMDSAFKRRWNFEYIGINEGSSEIKDSEITLKPYGTIKWDMLRTKINNGLTEAGVNEDKLIGPFFLSNTELKSSSVDEIFKSKLLMYLFEDVLKHRKGKLFKSEFNTFSKIIDAYNKSEEIFDFDVSSFLLDESSEESVGSLVAAEAENYSTENE